MSFVNIIVDMKINDHKTSALLLLFVIVTLVNFTAYSQFIKFHPADIRWSMAISQSSVDDWKQGNVKAIETGSSMDFRENINVDTFLLRINLKYAAGLLYKKDTKNNYETVLPTDNLLSGEGVLSYPLGWKLDPFFSASFITQISESFIVIKGKKLATAKLWDPVTSQQSWGFEYTYRDSLDLIQSRLGFSLKQIRSHIYTRLTDDRKTKDIKERYLAESGIQWKSQSNFKLTETLDYRATLDMFATFDDLTKWAVKFENEFKITVWEMLAILFKIDFAYDEKQALRIQHNQSFRFGIVMDIR